MRAIGLSCVLVMLSALGCSDSHPRTQEGGETHFLTACLDSECPEGLSCVCGVCTATCEDSTSCGDVSSLADCASLAAQSLVCEGVSESHKICDVTCARDASCEDLGAGFQCVQGRCRPEAVASVLATGGQGCTDEDCGASMEPLVMLIVDTSGSMERKPQCTCSTAACTECLPTCAGDTPDKNRWTQTLEALTGTFDDFSCEALDRQGPDFTYDADYVFPYVKPSGTQRDDGVLQEFTDRLRFGVATFDSVATYGRDTQLTLDAFNFARSADEDGLWSYPPLTGPEQLDMRGDGTFTGSYRYPYCEDPYVMDTGIRSRDAREGALIVGVDPSEARATVDAIHATLLATRPYGSTPIAAALDDVRELFERDASMALERRNPKRQRHLILISDGRADDDFRRVGCACFEDGDASDCGGAPNLALDMHCPYPVASTTARLLRCGDEQTCDSGVFSAVHVVGLAVADDAEAVAGLNAIARAGGSSEVLLANGASELRATLSELLEKIASHELDDSSAPPAIPEPPSRKSCTTGALVYPNGASWPSGCGTCECMDGTVSCTERDCTSCTSDDDCEGTDVCYFDADCQSGSCGLNPSEVECTVPINTTVVCTCDGLSLSVNTCDMLPHGVVHAGRCE